MREPTFPSVGLNAQAADQSRRDVKETCFFWYHGTCRSGKKCDREHEVRYAWPILPPVAFVHWRPCHLPLCPLRVDLIPLKRKADAPEVDGYPVLEWEKPSVEAEVEADLEEIHKRVQEQQRAKKKKGRGVGAREHAAQGPGAAKVRTHHQADLYGLLPEYETSFSDSLSGSGSALESESEMGVGTNLRSSSGSTGRSPSTPSIVPPLSPLTRTADTSTPSRKRKLAPTHKFAYSVVNKRARVTDTEPPVSSSIKFSLRPAQNTKANVQAAPASVFNSPRGPQAPKGLAICFYYYHQGYCEPKRLSNGKFETCSDLHTMNTDVQRVARPTRIAQHNKECQLPLCPFRK